MSIVSKVFSRAKNSGGAKNIAQKINNATTLTKEDISDEVSGLGRLIKYDEYGLPAGFSPLGKLAVGGTVLGASAISAARQRELNDMGSSDGRITNPTPDFSPYMNMKTTSSYRSAPAGADGSLVFALDRIKNGGFL